MKLFSKVVLAGVMGATVLAATPAEAHGYYGRGGGDGAAIAVGAGILGLAVGAAIASDHPRGYVVERDYVPPPPPPPAYYYDGPGYYSAPVYPRGYVYREVYRDGYRGGYYRGGPGWRGHGGWDRGGWDHRR